MTIENSSNEINDSNNINDSDDINDKNCLNDKNCSNDTNKKNYCALFLIIIFSIFCLLFLVYLFGLSLAGTIYGFYPVDRYCESNEYTGKLVDIQHYNHNTHLNFYIYNDGKIFYYNYDITIPDFEYYDIGTDLIIGANYTLYKECDNDNDLYNGYKLVPTTKHEINNIIAVIICLPTLLFSTFSIIGVILGISMSFCDNNLLQDDLLDIAMDEINKEEGFTRIDENKEIDNKLV